MDQTSCVLRWMKGAPDRRNGAGAHGTARRNPGRAPAALPGLPIIPQEGKNSNSGSWRQVRPGTGEKSRFGGFLVQSGAIESGVNICLKEFCQIDSTQVVNKRLIYFTLLRVHYLDIYHIYNVPRRSLRYVYRGNVTKVLA